MDIMPTWRHRVMREQGEWVTPFPLCFRRSALRFFCRRSSGIAIASRLDNRSLDAQYDAVLIPGDASLPLRLHELVAPDQQGKPHQQQAPSVIGAITLYPRFTLNRN